MRFVVVFALLCLATCKSSLAQTHYPSRQELNEDFRQLAPFLSVMGKKSSGRSQYEQELRRLSPYLSILGKRSGGGPAVGLAGQMNPPEGEMCMEHKMTLAQLYSIVETELKEFENCLASMK